MRLALLAAVALLAAAAEVPVLVVEREGPRAGRPISGARVSVLRVPGEGPFRAGDAPDSGSRWIAAGEDGRAAPAAPGGVGRILIEAVAPGFAPALAWGGEDGTPVRLALRAAAPVEFRVVHDAAGAGAPPAPVAGAEIRVTPAAGYEEEGAPRLLRRTSTGPDGIARIPDLPVGPFFDVEARAPGFAPGRAAYVLPGGAAVRIVLASAARLVGRVVRVPGGAPLPGVRVRGGGVEATTAPDGSFSLEGLPPGPVEVEAAAEGMMAMDRPVVRAEAGRTAPVPDLRLSLLGRVRVTVQDPAGKALPRVRVRLLPADESKHGGEVLTGSDGGATLEGVVPAAGHRLVIEPDAPWAPRVTDAFAALAGEEADLGVLRLDTGGVLPGEVVGPDGFAVPGATLVLFDGDADPLRVAAGPAAGGPLRRDLAAGADGKFRIERVPTGSRSILARAPGRLPAALTRIDVEPGRATPDLRLVLRPGAAVAGVLHGPDGAPVADALLLALAPPVGTEAGRARTGRDGRFRLEGLAPGALEVRVVLPEEAMPDPLRAPFAVVAPAEDLVLRLPARRSLEGVVLDPTGGTLRAEVVLSRLVAGPAAGPLLEVARELERIRPAADGTFATRPLPEGRWRLRAEAVDGRVASADVDVLPDGPVGRVTLTLASGSVVRGRVLTGPAARDPRGISIRLLLGGRSEASVPPAVVEDDGSFSVGGVPPGEHDLVVSLPGLAPVALHRILVPAEGGVVDVGDVLLGAGTTLRLRVYAETRAPMPDVPAAVVDEAGLRREESTGPSGLAVFGGLAAGPHVLELRLPSGTILRRPLEIPGEGEMEEVVDLGLDPPGTVEVRRGGGPVPGAAVRAFAAERGAGARAASVEVVADDRGLARVPALPEGQVVLEVTPPGEPPVRLACRVTDRRVEVVLPEDGIAGEVAAARDGAPVAGASVRAVPAEEARGAVARALGARGVAATTDARGAFRFPSLTPGEWLLEVSARGFGTARPAGVRVLRGGGPTPVRVLLEAAGRARGTVRDGAGRPVPGATVEATDPATGELLPGGRRTADAAGAYAMDGLVPGTVALTARAGGLGASPPEIVSLAPGEDRALDLELVPGGTLEVRVVGPGGVPVADAEVEVHDALGRSVPLPDRPEGPEAPLLGEGRTDADGLLRVPGVRAGVYLVSARKGPLSADVRARVDSRGGARTVLALLPPADSR